MADQSPKTQINPQVLQQGPTIAAALATTYDVMVTALPNGKQDTWLKLSVVFSPRLKPQMDTTLAMFKPLFTSDWPNFIKSLKFDVYCDSPSGPVQLPTQGEWEFAPPPGNVPPFDAPLWAAIFKETMLVRGYKFDNKGLTDEKKFLIHTFPEKALLTNVKEQLYQPIALEAPAQLPTKGMILNRLQNMQMVIPDVRVPGGFRTEFENPVVELNKLRQDIIQQKITPGVLQQGPGGLQQGPGGLQQQMPAAPGTPGMQGGPPGIQTGPRMFQRGVGDFVSKRSAAPKVADAKLQSQINVLQFQAFHKAYLKPKDQPIPPRPAPPQYDFHQIVGCLSEYPELAKRLALRVDLRVKVDPRMPANGTLWVRPVIADPNMAGRFISPKTSYVLGGITGFMSKPISPVMQDGLLKFGLKLGSAPVYDVVPGDVDGAVKRIENYSSKLVENMKPKVTTRAATPPGQTAPGLQNQLLVQPVLAEPTSLPPMRSAGLSVAHNQRDEWLDALLDRSKTNNEKLAQAVTGARGLNVILTGDDLIRGFRIDVREIRRGPGNVPVLTPWRSLNFRHGTYVLLAAPGAPPVLVADDEGWISLGVTQGDEPHPSDPMRTLLLSQPRPLQIYQSLFRWDGWSLCVQRPGKFLGIDDQPSQGQGSPLAGINMQIVFLPVPGTLPRLRFDRQYQFRARVVDLAGNSLAPAMDVPNPVDQFVTDINDGYYDRMEPVPSPPMALTAPLTAPPPNPMPMGPDGKPLFRDGVPLSPGESAERMVIRTMNVEKPGDPMEGGPAGPPPQPSGRQVFPPRISQELAEQHGMFDDPASKMMRGADAHAVMTTKDGQLSDLLPPDRRAMIAKRGEEFFPEPSLLVPYLPDPMATGVTFILYPPGADPTALPAVQVPFPIQGGWPNAGSFRLQLEPGNTPPDPGTPNLLRVFVPPGEERILRISCYLLPEKDPAFGQPNKENLFGIWRWIQERAAPQDRERLRKLVQAGRHWMVSPFHELTLVHATQQPVLTPQWVCIEELPKASYGQPNQPECTVQSQEANWMRHRHPGETSAAIDGTIAIHRPSTGTLDLMAKWREPIDDPDKKMTSENLNDWLYVEGTAAPFEVKISYLPSAAPGPVLARGVPGESVPQVQDPELAPADAQELPVLPEVQTRDVPGGSSQAPSEPGAATGEVQERGMALPGGAAQMQLQKQPFTPGVAQQPQIQKGPPIVAQPQPQGPPPYDESKDRCAPAPPPPPPPDYGQRFRFQGLHRFGDTRYRCVGYSAIGTTRYREYFRPMPDEEVMILKQGQVPPRWTRTSPPILLDILSTAQPDAPKPLYIVPTWRSEQTPQGRRRVGGGLRVYLERPWFSSGDGEKLAVILYPDPMADFSDPKMQHIKHYVTQWGLDPLWVGFEAGPGLSPAMMQDLGKMMAPSMQVTPRGSGPLTGPGQLGAAVQQIDPKILAIYGVGRAHPAPHHFRNAVTVRHDLGIQEIQVPLTTVGTRDVNPQFMAAQPMMAAALMTRPMPVTICAFEVKADPSRQLWYCDIEIDPGNAYFPFIRMAFARYQPNSIRGMHLSKVVLADFAQLVPDRTASVVPNPGNPNQVMVTVAGVQGSVGLPRTTIVEVGVEELDPNLPPELGWVPVPGSQPVGLPRANAQQWTGPVTLPPPGGKQYRLVVREYEVFAVRGEADTDRTVERRLVYADVVPIQR